MVKQVTSAHVELDPIVVVVTNMFANASTIAQKTARADVDTSFAQTQI